MRRFLIARLPKHLLMVAKPYNEKATKTEKEDMLNELELFKTYFSSTIAVETVYVASNIFSSFFQLFDLAM